MEASERRRARVRPAGLAPMVAILGADLMAVVRSIRRLRCGICRKVDDREVLAFEKLLRSCECRYLVVEDEDEQRRCHLPSTAVLYPEIKALLVSYWLLARRGRCGRESSRPTPLQYILSSSLT